MNYNLFFIFICLNTFNVIIQTIKSIMTIKCGKFSSAIVNAIAYGFYTIVVVYMMCDLPLLWKAGIVGACNFVGVFLVKLVEEKIRKDKLWKVEATVPSVCNAEIAERLSGRMIPFNSISIKNGRDIFNIYCETQKQSMEVKKILIDFGAKYFVSESKEL